MMSDENLPDSGGSYPANFTRAGVTGKTIHKAGGAARASTGKVKGSKMPRHRKRHVKALMRGGVISAKAAAKSGLVGK